MSVLEKDVYHHLTSSINKALNGIEAPLKTKHVRTAIIITHKTKEAKSFWMIMTRQPLMENRFTAWKFCSLLHKVLREGHRSILKESQSQKKMITEMGKLWGHLQDGVGNCIEAYTKMLVTKLSFHDKNRFICGSLLIDFADIIKFADNDQNIYFQLCVEIFDYLDDIIALQSKIFDSLNAYRMSSMTQQGQCRLAPLITLIQDSNALYDISVRLMFRLHDGLPNDILSGHRDRFRVIFRNLKYFYENVRPLQYFADLIQLPHLPSSAPNFTSKVDFGSYVPPVVLVQPDPEVQVEDLIDTAISDNIIQEETIHDRTLANLENSIKNKDSTIMELHTNLNYIKQSYAEKEKIHQQQFMEMQQENISLRDELVSAKEMCANLRILKEEMQLQLENTPSLLQKVSEEEEKAKMSVEKFTKLKVMYAQIRDEHIQLLRQQSDSVKLLNKERQTNSETDSKIKSLSNCIDEYEKNINELTRKNSELTLQLTDCKNNNQEMLIFQNDLKKHIDELQCKAKSKVEIFEAEINELEQKIKGLEEKNFELLGYKEKLQDANITIKKKDDQLSAYLKNNDMEMQRKNMELLGIQNDHQKKLDTLNAQMKERETTLKNNQSTLKEKELLIDNLRKEQLLLESKRLQDEKHTLSLQEKLNETASEANHLKEVNNDCLLKGKSDLSSLCKCIIKSMQEVCSAKIEDFTEQPLEAMYKISKELHLLLEKLNALYKNDYNLDIELYSNDCIKTTILFGYAFTRIYDQSILYCKETTEVEKGNDILNQIRSLSEPLQLIFEHIINRANYGKIESASASCKSILEKLNVLILDVLNTFQTNIDLDELVQNELKDMDLAIEEAAAKIMDILASARKKDNGIKLEVNERILDACTTLMECIKILIQKSRLLQNEIVLSHQGNSTTKEFYKRNSQWSEGLISASKSVAKAANFLVEAANFSVSKESTNNFELIVAAQEIAASTAQLVIASKVKAPKHSRNLVDLTGASRNVSKATGAVVATVKDGNQRLEQSIEMDLHKLTPSQMKTMEMEIQVKVLELEQALQMERLKLSSFRKKHYQSTEY